MTLSSAWQCTLALLARTCRWARFDLPCRSKQARFHLLLIWWRGVCPAIPLPAPAASSLPRPRPPGCPSPTSATARAMCSPAGDLSVPAALGTTTAAPPTLLSCTNPGWQPGDRQEDPAAQQLAGVVPMLTAQQPPVSAPTGYLHSDAHASLGRITDMQRQFSGESAGLQFAQAMERMMAMMLPPRSFTPSST